MKKPKIRQNELSVRIKIGSRWGTWVILALMLVLAAITLWPILWLLMSSLKTGDELTANP